MLRLSQVISGLLLLELLFLVGFYHSELFCMETQLIGSVQKLHRWDWSVLRYRQHSIARDFSQCPKDPEHAEAVPEASLRMPPQHGNSIEFRS